VSYGLLNTCRCKARIVIVHTKLYGERRRESVVREDRIGQVVDLDPPPEGAVMRS